MLLHRIHLDPRCKEVRRDLSDPYQLHSTLCRAFSGPSTKCREGEFLWRLEAPADSERYPHVLVQSRAIPDWNGINVRGWLTKADPAVDLYARLKLDVLGSGQRFRFRLRANPSVTRAGKRLGLLRVEGQEKWLERKGQQHGFSLPKLASFDFSESSRERVDVRVSEERMLHGEQRSGNGIRVFSALFDGMLIVTEPEKFRTALQTGIGHGKSLGLGLLSVAPCG